MSAVEGAVSAAKVQEWASSRSTRTVRLVRGVQHDYTALWWVNSKETDGLGLTEFVNEAHFARCTAMRSFVCQKRCVFHLVDDNK